MKSIDIAIPVYYGNIGELEPNINRQVEFFRQNLSAYDWRIVIAINGKNADDITNLSKKLSKEFKEVSYIYTPIPGKGAGVITAWQNSKADIVTYMDIDISTRLSEFKELVKGIEEGFDLCVGSRYLKGSKVRRSLKRMVVSFVYHRILLKFFLGVKFTDGQCGFKAVTREVVEKVLPLVKDREWFFESEMMYIAEKVGMSIKEIPVVWEETDLQSGINLGKVIPEFIGKIISLRFRKI
ncbi:glycosyltransferase [archaeon]|nr:MAG: glycosyltransferase [archaeon]